MSKASSDEEERPMTTETTTGECYCGKADCAYLQQHTRAVEDHEWDKAAVVTRTWRDWLASPAREAMDRAVADAVAAERARVLGVLGLAVRQSCACGACKEFIAALIRDEMSGSEEEARDG